MNSVSILCLFIYGIFFVKRLASEGAKVENPDYVYIILYKIEEWSLTYWLGILAFATAMQRNSLSKLISGLRLVRPEFITHKLPEIIDIQKVREWICPTPDTTANIETIRLDWLYI